MLAFLLPAFIFAVALMYVMRRWERCGARGEAVCLLSSIILNLCLGFCLYLFSGVLICAIAGKTYGVEYLAEYLEPFLP
jgi:hypothetical protein